MRLKDLIEAVRPLSVSGRTDVEVRSVVHDSRQVEPGALFAAVRGRKADASRFIPDAVERGAVAVIAEAPVPAARAAVLHVSNARRALADAACAFHGHPSRRLSVVGITGTNGKTTVSYMIRSVLEGEGLGTGLVGTIRYVMGERTIPADRTTPEATDLQEMLAGMAHAGCAAAVMEVSSHSLVQERVRGVEFDEAVFTNLTQDHLDYHGTVENYYAAKRMLFTDYCSGAKACRAIVNLDDAFGARLLKECACREKIAYGESPGAQVRPERISLGAEGSAFTVRSPWGDADLRLRLLGRYNVSNALAAFAACAALGVKPGRIAAALSAMTAVPGRLQELQTGRGFQVFVDYAHTHDAIRNVLGTLREIARNRLIIVFGCGGDRDRGKRPLMGTAASELSDFAVVTSDNPRSEEPSAIIGEIIAGVKRRDRVEVIEDRREAIGRAMAMAEPGDIVLIAGKGHENTQSVGDKVFPFDDTQVAREWLEKHHR